MTVTDTDSDTCQVQSKVPHSEPTGSGVGGVKQEEDGLLAGSLHDQSDAPWVPAGAPRPPPAVLCGAHPAVPGSEEPPPGRRHLVGGRAGGGRQGQAHSQAHSPGVPSHGDRAGVSYFRSIYSCEVRLTLL